MACDFHLAIYDPEVAATKGKPADIEFSLHGLTAEQAVAALPFLEKFTDRLKAFITKESTMALIKTGDAGGDGKVIPEPGDNQKTAAANFTEADKQALAEENAEADSEA